MRGMVAQLNISAGGMPKRSIASAMVTRDGVAGDWQRNRKYHGGPNRAICVFSQELYDWLAEQGVRIEPGSVGENFTTAGIDLLALAREDRLRVGGCTIEITDIRVPCSNLKQWHPDLPKLIEGRSGWMAKVVHEGLVQAGDLIERIVPVTGRNRDGCEQGTPGENAGLHALGRQPDDPRRAKRQ
jgi:MOSC domain-containing protein YiiM